MLTTAHHPIFVYARGESHNGNRRIPQSDCSLSVLTTAPRGLSACDVPLSPEHTVPFPCRTGTHGAAPSEPRRADAAMLLKYKMHEDYPAQSAAESKSSVAPVYMYDIVLTSHTGIPRFRA